MSSSFRFDRAGFSLASFNRGQKIFIAAAVLVVVVGSPFWASKNHRYQMERRVVEAWIADRILAERALYESLGDRLFVETDEAGTEGPKAGDPTAEELKALDDPKRASLYESLQRWERMPDDERRALMKNYRAYWRLDASERSRLRKS